MRCAAVLAAVVIATACVAEPARHAPASALVASTAPVAVAEDVADDCLACHTADLLRQQRLTDKQWTKTVDKMRTWGAPTEDDGVAPLLAHLVTVGARDAGPFQPQVLSADEAASLFARQPDGAFGGGNAKRGATLYADQCAPCHADHAEGGSMGVALAGRHVLDRAKDVAAIVRAGRGRMPGFDTATDADIADYLAHLRSLSESAGP
jgi:mono/diheme cytochrome c family protein